MSAIDMFASIEDIEGKLGEKRLCLTLNGKVNHCSCLPHCDVWYLHLSSVQDDQIHKTAAKPRFLIEACCCGQGLMHVAPTWKSKAMQYMPAQANTEQCYDMQRQAVKQASLAEGNYRLCLYSRRPLAADFCVIAKLQHPEAKSVYLGSRS